MMDQSDASSLAIQPLLVVRDALRAIEFYSAVLGAREKWRLMHFDRVGHAVMRLDDAEFIVLDEFPEAGIVSPLVADPSDPPPPGPRLLVRVDDVDAVLERAVAAGATLLGAAQDQWWGVRAGSFRDPFGHRWSVRTVREPITIQEMQRRADELGLYPPPRDPQAEPAITA
ncbi:MAG TPA: VOC family protein [Chloroflexota bacterium]